MRKNITLIIYISFAVVLSAIETVILPTSVIPGVKLGFANLVILVSLYQFGIKEAYFVSFIRVLIVSFVLGSFLTPTFMISMGGMIFSLLGLTIFFKAQKFSIVGVSIIASVMHIVGQVFSVMIIMNLDAIINVAPFLIYIAILTGAIIGYIAKRILRVISIKTEVIYEF
ncbi:MAG: Gx transporter family protein [Bacilli bacterium]